MSLQAHFEQITGQKAALHVVAPGRINLLGEHTDYNDGWVLPAAIDKSIEIAIAPRPDTTCHFWALDLSQEFTCSLPIEQPTETAWANHLLGVIAALQRRGLPLPCGVNVMITGNIPLGAGLSSSAALESGFVFALNALFVFDLSRTEMALIAQEAEHTYVGVRCGIMDMYASLHGRADHFLQLDCRNLQHTYFPFHLPDYQFVLCNSGVKHALAESAYNDRRAACEQGVQTLQATYPTITHLRDVTTAMLLEHAAQLPPAVLRQCQYVVEEMQRVRAMCEALAHNDVPTIGRLLYATHEGLKTQYEVSCKELDVLVDTAKQTKGVVGSRLMGGGFGGCTLNLVKKSEAATAIATLSTAYDAAFGSELITYTVSLTDGVRLAT